MAEVTVKQKGGRKTSSPRIDLTPMVDLGFLLITFFMYTTSLAKPNAMTIAMPDSKDTSNPQKVVAESTITLIPVSNHKTVYYEGFLNGGVGMKECANSQLRDVLLQKKRTVAALPATFSPAAHKMYVLIKPASNCTYADVVAILDEMDITNIPLYTIVDVTAEEQQLIAKKF